MNPTRFDVLLASASTELELVKTVLRFIGIGFHFSNGVLTVPKQDAVQLTFNSRGELR